jgi:predicted DNA-binding protein
MREAQTGRPPPTAVQTAPCAGARSPAGHTTLRVETALRLTLTAWCNTISITEIIMTTVRLPPELEQKLQVLSEAQHRSKSELIKEALELFLKTQESEKDSYEIGKDLFGKYGSGQGNLSQDYKQLLKDKIRAKHRSR